MNTMDPSQQAMLTPLMAVTGGSAEVIIGLIDGPVAAEATTTEMGRFYQNRRNQKGGLIMFQTTLRTLALTATLLTAPAWADEGFTNRDFKGDYAFHLDGVLTSLGAPMVTAYNTAVGRFTADGAGNITQGTRSLSANGRIFEETFTCTYNINRNGTGKAICAFSVFGPSTLDLVLRDDGDEFYFNLTSMPSTTGQPVLQGVGRRQSSALDRGDHG
jgi:hypothetical protein